ncbi:MAG: CmpA/NrtA family ABC transporter substrate-binding protein [Verrucomicrobiota bacterium]
MVSIDEQGTSTSPRRTIRLGYVPLVDCAPILIARDRGLFEKQGLNVIIEPQPGWATVREKLVHDELDAAECLGPLAVAIHHGVGTRAKKMSVPLIISANGNGITLSNEIPTEIIETKNGLLNYLDKDWDKDRPFTLASVHPCSSHHSLLLQWLRQQGVANHPRLNVISLPPQVVGRNLASGHIDGFCVGEPWNSVAILSNMGWCAATSTDLSNGHPEKVLATTSSFAEREPEALHALTLSLLQACHFCQNPQNREIVLQTLCNDRHLSTYADAISNSLLGKFQSGPGTRSRKLPDFHIFHGGNINAPTSQASSWLRDGLRTAGLVPKNESFGQDNIFRMDLFNNALSEFDSNKNTIN